MTAMTLRSWRLHLEAALDLAAEDYSLFPF